MDLERGHHITAGRAGSQAACSGLESSDRVDSTLSPGLCLCCVPAPWSKFIELINSFSYLSSLGQSGGAGLPVAGALDTGFTVCVCECVRATKNRNSSKKYDP